MATPTRQSDSAQRSSFVPQDERERLVGLFAQLVAEHGVDQVGLEELAARAGVGLDTVSGYFDSPEEWALYASEVATGRMFSAAAQAFMSTPGDCPLAARAALEALLHSMASMPEFMHLAVVEYGRLGPRADARRQQGLNHMAEFLGPGFAAAGQPPPQPELLSLLIAGGIFEVVGKYYLEGRLEQLPEALPAITYFTVAPFFGIEEARRVAGPPPVAPG